MYLEYLNSVNENSDETEFRVVENGKFKGVNWVQGDRIVLYVSNNLIQRARIESDPGSSRGRFVPPGFKLTEETATGQKPETNKSPKPVLQRRKQDRGG
ncbi:MAG: hypothetical protein D6814_14100 [Calditrichaeota bacterium]|nr:MAG: hypothetical protein D6814_14100 [Calditrichota bacterium]